MIKFYDPERLRHDRSAYERPFGTKRIRWRVSLLVLGSLVSLLVLLTHLWGGDEPSLSALNAGPLTGDHRNFTGPQGCAACHEAHGLNTYDWVAAVFTDSDMTDKCLECHDFGGPPRAAHNQNFSANQELNEITCVRCHSEHKGINADISVLSDSQCADCHTKKFDRFDLTHPEFGPRFPHFRRPAIKFDHTSHLGKHFGDERFKDYVPVGCVGCHEVKAAGRQVPPGNYSDNCAGCHSKQIQARELVVLDLPELFERPAEVDEIIEACGATAEQFEALRDDQFGEDEEEFSSVSGDGLGIVTSFLFDAYPDDPDAYGESYREFLVALMLDGSPVLAELVANRLEGGDARNLFAGLNPEAVRQLACAWAANQEYELPTEAEFGGWYGDFTELKYRPLMHADPVMQAWIDVAVSLDVESGNDEQNGRALSFQELVLSSKDGPGSCMKCHSVSENKEGRMVNWRYREDAVGERPHHWYSHSAHLQIVGTDGISLSEPLRGCATCHQLNSEVDFSSNFDTFDDRRYDSNFHAVKKDTCVQCHAEDRVRQDCQLCHRYHVEPDIKAKMLGERVDARADGS